MPFTKPLHVFAGAVLFAVCGCQPATIRVQRFEDLDAAINKPVHLVGKYEDEWKSGPTVVVFGAVVWLDGDVDTYIPGFVASAGGPNPNLFGAAVTVDGVLKHYTQPPTDRDDYQNIPSHFYIENAKLRLNRAPTSAP